MENKIKPVPEIITSGHKRPVRFGQLKPVSLVVNEYTIKTLARTIKTLARTIKILARTIKTLARTHPGVLHLVACSAVVSSAVVSSANVGAIVAQDSC